MHVEELRGLRRFRKLLNIVKTRHFDIFTLENSCFFFNFSNQSCYCTPIIDLAALSSHGLLAGLAAVIGVRLITGVDKSLGEKTIKKQFVLKIMNQYLFRGKFAYTIF